ncbi:mannose-6-phosphate isomerase, class I [Chitinophagaceae bacterium LB-8]|uniref:mannose-6-phosphate isomerase n=1 Tax=Paraflavisolibacter caeni TaxID=2982496 RepID=A0A9X3BGN3_9BACT|nr:mannose-6-phosphate isomerase, class I [Paraflavisolibacter caeni]MCU7548077.1 mannose-6-phosphate isomerase, class I [Paraflavisolibacter caeni]
MSTLQNICKLKGKVQHYSWGGTQYIPNLLGTKNPDQKPYAEYWLGAHPNHSSTVEIDGQETALNQLIQQNKLKALGQEVVERFGELPYLLKVLDVKQMLSIQVHPSKPSAEVGYAAENAIGIPVTAPHRNYKDENHKPELMVALSDFWLLHGFKPADQLKEVLSAVPDFDFLLEEFEKNGYQGLYEKVMLMDQEEVNQILGLEVARVLPLYKNGELLKSQEEFWVARAAETFCKDGQYDRGIFSIYLFNLVHLQVGEGIYQPAQLPHAYLEGQNVEIMANSDNVLRAGLTDKHIDVHELMKHVRFEETIPTILGAHAHEQEEIQFKTPAPEFELYQYLLQNGEQQLRTYSAEILLVLDGSISVKGEGVQLSLSKGEAAFVCAGTSYQLVSNSPAEVYRAAVPQMIEE